MYHNEKILFYADCNILIKQRSDIRTKREQSFCRNYLEPKKKTIDKKNHPIPRSILPGTANAYLYNNTVCIDFNETLPTVTILLINESTGETVYSETCDAPTNISINLDEESCGNYSIQIESDEAFLYGSFTL